MSQPITQIGQYIDVHRIGDETIWQTEKTAKYKVLNRHHQTFLGEIRWYGPWRQYCFFPAPSLVFSKGCLQDINNFIDRQMALRQQKRKEDH